MGTQITREAESTLYTRCGMEVAVAASKTFTAQVALLSLLALKLAEIRRSLPQDEIVSRILFGNSVGQLSALQAVQLAASLNTLRGSGGGLNPLGKLRQVAGIDRLRILGADDTSGRGTALAAGKYI